MRLSFAFSLETRDGVLDKDALLKNGYIEIEDREIMVYKRQGLAAPYIDLTDGAFQGVRSWRNRLYIAIGGNVRQIVGGALQQTYALSNSGQMTLSNTGVAPVAYLFLKDTTKAWVLTEGNPGTLTQITDVDYPAVTVPGVAYLDETFYVMEADGTVHGCDTGDPLSWAALNEITAESTPDQGVAITSHNEYVVAMKERSIELFYNARNATGSPLARVESSDINIGCANGYSLAKCDGALFFLSRTQSKQASVHVFPVGSYVPQEITTPDVRRVLATAAFSEVYSWAASIDGHSFYVLDLKSDNITLVYDITAKEWSVWTQLTIQNTKSVTSLVQVNGLATVTVASHGYSDGDPVIIAGANQSGYNGTTNITYIDANSFSYPVDAATISPATGTITAQGYTSARFPAAGFVEFAGKNYVIHETTGVVSEIVSTQTSDNGVPIDFHIRTANYDPRGRTKTKKNSSVTVIGDQVNSNILLRYSDDDYQNWSKYRRTSLNKTQPTFRRMGSFSRRAYELRHTGDTRLRLQALDVEGM